MKRIKVRIWIAVLLMASILLSLCGCEVDPTTDPTNGDSIVAQPSDDSENQFAESAPTEPTEQTKPTNTNLIAVPKSSVECEALHYSEAVELFINAGFTNVMAVSTETEDYGQTTEGSIIIVSVDDNPIFEKGQEFASDVLVVVYYRTLVEPKPTEPPPTQPAVMVWIPANGSKYHSRSSCSNMKNPTQVTKEAAEQMGYEPCKRCH